jgi:YVTN family beta-propeller protein
VSCDPAGAPGNCDNLSPSNEGGACAGGEFCTINATCQAGACVGEPRFCDDGDPCTVDGCNELTDACESMPAAAGTTCPDQDGNVCTVPGCNGAGNCDQRRSPAPGTTPCDADGNLCTTDHCDGAGNCILASEVSCGAPTECDGGQTCNPATGLCEGASDPPAGTPCADTDGNVCTTPGCDGTGGCDQTHMLVTGVPCDDMNACTVGETCHAGSCSGGTPRVCSDGNTCNGVESCSPLAGCQAGTPPVCDDANACTTDGCDPGSGCTHTPITACLCPDDAACDDGNPCTEDSCDPATGCAHAARGDGATCDDGLFCTVGDACANGTCGGAPRDCATLDTGCASFACDEGADDCTAQPVNEGGACDDGNACTSNEACSGGSCLGSGNCPPPGEPVNLCDGEKLCRDGACAPITTEQGSACAATPGMAFVSNADDQSVSIIDGSSRAVVATIPVGITPWGVAVNPSGTRAYVSNRGTDERPLNTVSVVDTLSRTVASTVEVGVRPLGVAVHPAGTPIYAANYGANINQPIDSASVDFVSAIDREAATVIASIPAGVGPAGLAVNPAGTRLYVTNYADDTVSVVDTTANAVVATVPVGSRPLGVAVHPGTGDRVYVGHFGGNTVSVIGAVSNTVLATITVGQSPFGLAIEPVSDQIYVANMDGGTVSAIDATTNTVRATIDVGGSPMGLAVDTATQQLYVVSRGTDEVSIIDTATNTVRMTLRAGRTPVAIGRFIGVVERACPRSALKCDDGNPLTTDRCVSSTGCQAGSLTGADAAAAGVESLDSTLDDASRQARVDAGTATRLSGILDRVQEDLQPGDVAATGATISSTTVAEEQTAVSKKARRHAASKLKRFIQQVRKRSVAKRGRTPKVRPDVGMTLVDVARGTVVELRRAGKKASTKAQQKSGPLVPRRLGRQKPPPPTP